MAINFALGENGCHTHSSLGGRSIVVGRQADKILAVHDFLKFDNFNSIAYSVCLNGFMKLIVSHQ